MGIRPLALGGVWLLFWLLVLVVVLRVFCLCSFLHHQVVFPFLSMMTWAHRPHGVRTRGKKKLALLLFGFFSLAGEGKLATALWLGFCSQGYGFLKVFSPLIFGIWRQESKPLGLV